MEKGELWIGVYGTWYGLVCSVSEMKFDVQSNYNESLFSLVF